MRRGRGSAGTPRGVRPGWSGGGTSTRRGGKASGWPDSRSGRHSRQGGNGEEAREDMGYGGGVRGGAVRRGRGARGNDQDRGDRREQDPERVRRGKGSEE